ncbi:unnamed protein product, partial [Porites evermanni]
MAEGSSSLLEEEYKPLDTPLDTWNVEEVKCFITHHFSNEVASKFEGKVLYFEVALSSDDDRTFEKLGLLTFSKVCKFRKVTESLMPRHSRSWTPSSQLSLSSISSPKPKLSEISNFSKDIQLLYKAKRGRIQRAAVQMWPGNDFPNFRLAEEKAKLDQLAASLEEECSIPEISFGFEGIKKHIQSVFNERRRSRKRERIHYDLPDKRMSIKGKDNGKPPLPTMSEYDDIKEVNKKDEDKDQISNYGSSGE